MVLSSLVLSNVSRWGGAARLAKAGAAEKRQLPSFPLWTVQGDRSSVVVLSAAPGFVAALYAAG